MISSGKSTLIQKLNNVGYTTVDEFRENDIIFKDLLQQSYEGKKVNFTLQTYFTIKHHVTTECVTGDYIVDRDILEHLLFSKYKLNKEEYKVYCEFFNTLVKNHKFPDMYILLYIDWDTFKDRLFKRGRKSEIDNFEENETFFKNLLSNYMIVMVELCNQYKIKFQIIDVCNQTPDEVFEEVLKILLKEYENKRKTT